MDSGAAVVAVEDAVAVAETAVAVSDVAVVVGTVVVGSEEDVVEDVETEDVVVVGIEDVVGKVADLDEHPHTLGRRSPELLVSSDILVLTWCRDELTQQAMDLSSCYLGSPCFE